MKVFSEHVEQLFLDLSLHKSIFLCGDFNIDILKHNSNRGIKIFPGHYVWNWLISTHR